MANISKAEKARRAAEAEAAKAVTTATVAGLDANPVAALGPEQLGALSADGINAIDQGAERIAAERAEQQRIADERAEAERVRLEEAEALAKLATAPDDSHLIPVTKDGETIHVHPAALIQHQAIGWKLLDA